MDLLPLIFSIILSWNPHSKNLIKSQIYLGTTDEKKNYKVHTIKILLDGDDSTSITSKDIVLCSR